MQFRDLPVVARVYVVLVCGLALAMLVLALNGALPGWATAAPIELVILIAVAATIAHSFPISTPGKQAYHVSLPFFVTAAVLFSPLQLLACIGLVNAVEHVRHRRSAFAQLFNVSAYSLSALSAQLTYHGLWNDPRGSIDIAQPGCLLAGVLAALVFISVNRVLVSFAIRLGNGIPLREQRLFEVESLLTDAVLLLMGLPLAHLAYLAPWAAAVGAAPLWLIHRVLDLPNVRAQRRQDGLTELFTAAYLTEACTRELNRAKRFGRSMTLVLLDVDALGELNATYGPRAGDTVIRGAAIIIRKATREYDLAARLAGGMFAVLLPETDLAQAQVVVERARRAVAEKRHELADSVDQVRVTVSVGVVVAGDHFETATQLFAAAEEALATAKRLGGNRAEFALEPIGGPVEAPPDGVVEPVAAAAEPLPTLIAPRHSTLGAQALAVSLGVLAAAVGTWAVLQAPGAIDWPTIGLLVALAVLAETRALDLFERSSFSMSTVPLLAACVLLGPPGVALLAVVIGLVRGVSRRARWDRVLVDTSAYLLAGTGAAVVFGYLGGPPSLEAVPALLGPAVVAGLVFYLHTLPIAAALAIELRIPPHRIWLDRFRWQWLQFVALGGLGLLLAVAYHVFGLIGAAAFVVPPIVMRYVTKQYLDRAVDNMRRLRTRNAQLEHQAFHDPLTNLANRALFSERLAHAFSRPDQGSIAVLFLDLDDFKVVNDTLGHAAGDTLLTIVTQRLRQCVRWEDTIARLGGDEFTVLLENVRDVNDAARSAERISDALRKPFNLDGQEVFVSASIGLALDTDRSHGPDDLLREADLAMYRAKSAGKSRYEIFDPGMSTHAMERLDLETDLRYAAERGELVVYYQPQFDLASGQIESIEALLHWRHPRRGVLQPSDFMPLAEESGRIVELGQWCLEQACRDAAGWQLRLPGVPVVVNLSVRQLEHAELLAEVASVLAHTGLLPELLTLEIAESAAMRDAAGTAETLRALRQLGPRIALDQFGNGYSSLAYLNRFPIDALKIEGAIVAHLEDLETRALVRGVVALARALNLRVGADDVATADQAAQLRALGCHTAQGDAFGAPCPVAELLFVGTAAAA